MNKTQMCEEHVSVHDCSVDIQQYFVYDKTFIAFFSLFSVISSRIAFFPTNTFIVTRS